MRHPESRYRMTQTFIQFLIRDNLFFNVIISIKSMMVGKHHSVIHRKNIDIIFIHSVERIIRFHPVDLFQILTQLYRE
ncbi:hypothetical protein SDC9_189572 [bioreactor metagenome]|uniref:Uncharacterized protein n=1 Tax=bioreactor metagenome TaxID=1076179 RepID=A0A645HTX0_9ZZZZ